MENQNSHKSRNLHKPNVRQITPQSYVDLFLTHVEILDRPAPRCDATYQSVSAQYLKHRNQPSSSNDAITAYIFARSQVESDHSYCIEVPFLQTCYVRVPKHFEDHEEYVGMFVDHLLTTLFGGNARLAKPYATSLTGKLVKRLHAFGYRPEPYYVYIQLNCSSRFIYTQLRRYLSSKDTFRSPKQAAFYSRLFTLNVLAQWKITDRTHISDLQNANPTHDHHWYTREWFVAHEFLDDVPAFLKSINLTINGWVRVHHGSLSINPTRRFSNARNEIICPTPTSVQGVSLDIISKDQLAHICCMTFDIECVSDVIIQHPHTWNAHDKVTQIGTKSYSILNRSNAKNITFTLGDPHASPKTTYRKFKHETGLLVGFAEHVREVDVDIYTHFNGNDFDWDYMHKRACLALFCQTSPNWLVAKSRWMELREQYTRYMPVYASYIKLKADNKKPEEQEAPFYVNQETKLFDQMRSLTGAKRSFGVPRPDPYKAAIWEVQNEIELEKMFKSFRAQPSIESWFYMHRMRCTKIGFDVRAKCSAALGSQLLKTPDDGRTNSDLFLYIKTSPQYALDKYSLEACADHFLDDQNKDNLLDHYTKHSHKIELRHASSTRNAYRMMYEYVHSGKPELLRAVCEYCIQDVEVTDLLADSLGVVMELVSTMKRNRVVLQTLTRRAQQFRFLTNMAFESQNKFVFNSYDRTATAPTYQGAVVLPPKWGLHGGPHEWVFCLDFASLYPTIMRERNFCCRSYILPCDRPRILKMVMEKKHPALLVIPYTQQYTKGQNFLGQVLTEVPLPNTAYFAVLETKDTILPQFLERMGNDRNSVKARMKPLKSKSKAIKIVLKLYTKHPSDKDKVLQVCRDQLTHVQTRLTQECSANAKKKLKGRVKELELQCQVTTTIECANLSHEKDRADFQHMVLDSEQKAIKVGMNSVYGSLGVKNGTITGLQEIAMSVTYCGRMYIYKTRDFCFDYAATTPGWEDIELDVVYGDSVVEDTPLLVRYHNRVRTMRIDELHDLFNTEFGPWRKTKECVTFDPEHANCPEAWSMDESGKGCFVKIRRLIRHSTQKPIHQVVTSSGMVECTSDHSLLRATGQKVSPDAIRVGDELLHVGEFYQGSSETPLKLLPAEAFCLGRFAATESGPPAPNFLNDAIYMKYGHLFFGARGKRIPSSVLYHPDLDVVQEFWRGFWKTRDLNVAVLEYIDEHGKELCLGMTILAQRLGSSLWSSSSLSLNAHVRVCKPLPKSLHKSLRTKASTRFVYDLEMADDLHRFHVGPGNLMVHNTDSVFPKLTHKRKAELPIEKAWEMASTMAEVATTTLYNPPHKLELEYGTCKIAWFYELDEDNNKIGIKKRYISTKFMEPDMTSGKLSASGVEIKRRGSISFVRTVYQHIVDAVWGHSTQDGKVVAEDTETTQRRVVEVYRADLVAMEEHQVDPKEFAYTRGLTTNPNEYKNPNQPHVQAAIQEIEACDRGDLPAAPQAGDRISFVPIYRKRKFLDPKYRKSAECVVSSQLYDPSKHVLDRKKAIDDLVNPVGQVMQPLMLDPGPMARASALKCRADDAGQTQLDQNGGAKRVRFEACLLKDPVKRKADQQTLAVGRHVPRTIVRRKGMHKAKIVRKKRAKVVLPSIKTFFK